MAKVYDGLKKFGASAFIVGAFHDELLIECDEGDAGDVQDVVEAAMLKAMEELLNADPLKVRIKVSGGVSPVWTK